ncbi:hypothetical protein [Effusibacillus dendaii]|uniref:Uncharacterized protein n=1 Tax=Effusibacillus dendaii TaxID=2743772 RepID=A0A7I8D7N4_9BACL|nr:hypothetical protein [Effusibacillus dendaii]BCJ86173.1 hypothetical protein skT53_11580 [Effusibacillus dendaii]
MDAINGLQDLALFLEEFFSDSVVRGKLEWQLQTDGDSIILAQVEGPFDFCDVLTGKNETEIALEFMLHPQQPGHEVSSIAIPVDPDDVEVNILDQAIEIESMDYYLLLHITNHLPND